MLGHKAPGNGLRLPPLTRSLSAKLLLLTIVFVMLTEVMIYAPSIGRMRLVYLEERLAAAHLSILALEATPDNMVSKEMEAELLQHVGAYMVALRSEEHTSELQSLMRISYAVFCLKKKKTKEQ